MKKVLYCLVVSFFVNNLAAQQKLNWTVAYSDNIKATPTEFIPATVPGAVQLDFAKAKNYGPYYYAENWKDFLWMENKFYTYKSTFQKPKLDSGERLYFISKGIDYEFDIFINNKEIFSQEGMFTWVRLDITDELSENNELKVVIHPVPKSRPYPLDRSQANHVVKPAVSYTWDWHPRLVPLGIWDDTYLEIQNPAYVNDVWINYALNDELSEATIDLKISGRNLSNTSFKWTLTDENGKQVSSLNGKTSTLEASGSQTIFSNPKLWWPHDYGEPYLYDSNFELINEDGKVIQAVKQKVGFRRVRLVMNEGAWNEPADFPKGRSNAPAQFEVNGVNIFAKGTNWVNPEIFPGIITKERYDELTDRAVEANFNMLRIWGGGIVNKEAFYELCDEKGLLVWQEFPLACNNYPDNPHYLKILEQEAVSIVNRLKKHTSIALWSGGNELFNSWSGMTDQSYALRLLNSITYRLNPETPFIPTSPVVGMGHGHYVFKDQYTGEEVYSVMQRAHFTAYTEFGMPAPSSIEILKKIIPANELWPPREGTSWESHHAFKAWIGETWLMPNMLEGYFGPADNLEELVERGQLIQCEGYKAIYEEARRQKPYCAMALNWCFNEPWPTAANNSIINYPNIAKPGFYAVSNACRPVCSSARISKLKWKEGENFSLQLWMLNDLPKEIDAGTMVAKIAVNGKEIEISRWSFDRMDPLQNTEGPTITPYKLPFWNTERFKLVLDVEGKPQYRSEYIFLYQSVSRPNTGGTKTMNTNN